MPMIQAALNGACPNPQSPRSPAQILADAVTCSEMGLQLIHVHCFDDNGEPTLNATTCDKVMGLLRRRLPKMAVSLTTSLAIEPDPARRLHLVQSWKNPPDYISINQSEAGIAALGTWFLNEGGGLEACVASQSDANSFVASSLSEHYSRVILEALSEDVAMALDDIAVMEYILSQARLNIPQYHHGLNASSWPIFERALRRGHNLRAGFEDAAILVDGRAAKSNEEILKATKALTTKAPA